MDQNGRPVCSQMWPGNATDVTTLIDRLCQRFASADARVVAAAAITDTAHGESKFNIERDNPMRPIRHGTTV